MNKALLKKKKVLSLIGNPITPLYVAWISFVNIHHPNRNWRRDGLSKKDLTTLEKGFCRCYNGKWCNHGNDFAFRSEQDYLIFILQWN
jgi:hypothetical protein